MRLLFWRKTRVPVVELHGTIAARGGGISFRAHGALIEAAIRRAKGKGGGHVILDIDSPGGSPVQSDLLAQAIRRAAQKDGVTVHAAIGEVGASGGYWIACAADEIVVNPMSIVGSIGVVGGGFGFVEALARLGIERRLHTAGRNKARLDPFSPERPEDVQFLRSLMDDLHARFKDWVRSRRGSRLKADEAGLFDGSFFLGDQALGNGLADRTGDVRALVREFGGEAARALVFRPKKPSLLRRLPRLAAGAVFDEIEARGAWWRLR